MIDHPEQPPQGRTLMIDGVTHRYGGSTAVDDVTLDIRGGELVALLGPSGCGKTTLLRIIAGFIAQTRGRVLVGGEAIDDQPPNKRAVGIVFQNYALFPHMTVAENVAYGLAARGADRRTQAAESERMLELVQLGHLAGRYPKQLSGGQQQRVALARALAVKPAILLLDEPFAALDKNLRLDMQIEVKRIQRMAGTTTILVTHDQEEALSMADRVAVLSQGRLEQFAPPTEVYDAPATLFVNSFVGTANLLGGTLLGADTEGARVRLDGGAVIETRAPVGAVAPGGRVTVCLRPEHLTVVGGGSDGDEDGIPGVVDLGLPLGATVVHEVRIGTGTAVKVAEPRRQRASVLPPGTPVRLAPAGPRLASVFPQAA
ncbi:ABC transporter ATP-binding protein [Azospirillum sp. RWY-5-1]|uniref:ABC transporter ATP-binding protein n=1 Tax=Azospirillum oleiclasticum TaxID=2735135 RepID=A0ABX2TDV6_9PROT|nr:ABC transporter ATP-binding protein [Azospirillum oleiclasticum]NYZ15494.1 ABC transporter ATP-binding protein [Azospirillum oleiclasticum]NYZ22517.1 ABC transporter ATP-binding protein [Azospirillum oleiclasticum]